MFLNWFAFMYAVFSVIMFFYAKEYRFLDRLTISLFWLPIWIWFQIRKLKKNEGL